MCSCLGISLVVHFFFLSSLMLDCVCLICRLSQRLSAESEAAGEFPASGDLSLLQIQLTRACHMIVDGYCDCVVCAETGAKLDCQFFSTD